MDIKEIPGVVVLLTLIGMLIGVGLITLIALGDASRITNVVTNESHVFTTNSTGTALTQTEVKSVTSLSNISEVLTENSDYNVTIGATATYILVDASIDGNTLNVTYEYYTDATATTAMDNAATALSSISTTWLALIITIICLSIIMVLVIMSFSGGR